MKSAIQFIHKYIWSYFPYALRRNVLFKLSGQISPKAHNKTQAKWPIIIVGCFKTASGLGQSARLSYEALKQLGLPVYGIDVSQTLMQKLDMADYQFEDGRSLQGPATLIVHVNAPLIPLALLTLGHRFVRDKRVIGYWAWELPQAPDDWRHGPPCVHDIWVTSQFTANAIKPIAGSKPVHVIHHPVALTQPPLPADELSDHDTPEQTRPLQVLTLFNAASSLARKNPVASILAFQKAFTDPSCAHLTVKAMNLDLYPEGAKEITDLIARSQNISLIEATMDKAELSKLYQTHDVVLSLHRAEGFGLPIVEAMLAGKVVIATDWSGNTDFLTHANGCPVPFTLIPARDPQQTYEFPSLMWADPDIDAAAQALQRLYQDKQLRLRLGRQAAEDARQAFGAHSYARHIMQALDLSLPNQKPLA